MDVDLLKKEPLEIANGIYWVGYYDANRKLHCNPYLIIEEDEAVLIDGGSRGDFSNVMLKILRTGLKPAQIKRLIYQHYDPDLCGSLPQFEAIIDSSDLKIISHLENNLFIHYYSEKTEKIDFRDLDSHYDFKSGRRLEFYGTPFCHQPGSFITYDTETKTLFSSDLYGSFDNESIKSYTSSSVCQKCLEGELCSKDDGNCTFLGIAQFHQRVMPSKKAFHKALDLIDSLDVERIAPQHGSIIETKNDVKLTTRLLRKIKNVGIDYLTGE